MFLRISRHFVFLVQMRENITHFSLNLFEKYAKIVHFCYFLREILKPFENSPAWGGGLSPRTAHEADTLKCSHNRNSVGPLNEILVLYPLSLANLWSESEKNFKIKFIQDFSNLSRIFWHIKKNFGMACFEGVNKGVWGQSSIDKSHQSQNFVKIALFFIWIILRLRWKVKCNASGFKTIIRNGVPSKKSRGSRLCPASQEHVRKFGKTFLRKLKNCIILAYI